MSITPTHQETSLLMSKQAFEFFRAATWVAPQVNIGIETDVRANDKDVVIFVNDEEIYRTTQSKFLSMDMRNLAEQILTDTGGPPKWREQMLGKDNPELKQSRWQRLLQWLNNLTI